MTKPTAESSGTYDAFISHAATDLAHARKLADRLVVSGLRVFLLEWEAPGVVEIEAKESALVVSTNGILVFSRATMADRAIRDDYAALLWRTHNGGRRFIPVKVDEVVLPPFAAIRKPVDLYGAGPAEYDDRVAALVSALRSPGAVPHTADPLTSQSRIEIRMGLAVDIVSYSARSSPLKEDAQRRLATLAEGVLKDLSISPAQTDQQGAGDGMNLFLPATVEVHRALPVLLNSWRDRLAADNRRFADRIRLRLALAVGPVGPAAMGFTGSTIVEMNRLLDSGVLRKEMVDRPELDLAVLVSDKLYDYVVGEGYPGLDATSFRRRHVSVKEFSADAWLWTGQLQRC